MKLIVEQETKQRLDQYLSAQLTQLTRSKIQQLIKDGNILVNNSQIKPKHLLTTGDEISVTIPEERSQETLPEPIPLDILYEDDSIIVINKASGMVVHPAAGNQTGTLVNALLHHCKGNLADQADQADAQRPGIVHRLDKDTSGCIVIAKTQAALLSLIAQFKDRSTTKQYLTVVQGTPSKPQDTLFTNIGRHPVNRLKMAVCNPGSGKSAITSYQLLHTQEETQSSLLLCNIHTGRTHQIRVHMVHLGTPILGDPIYAKINRQTAQPGRLMLHAWKLSITHPATNQTISFEAPIPSEFSPWSDNISLTT